MNKSQHTPGPWRYEKHGIGSFLVGADGSIIAGGDPSEGYMDGSTSDESLIAAAPELLEALQALDLAFMAHTFWNGDPPFEIAQARAAIAKATGASE